MKLGRKTAPFGTSESTKVAVALNGDNSRMGFEQTQRVPNIYGSFELDV